MFGTVFNDENQPSRRTGKVDEREGLGGLGGSSLVRDPVAATWGWLGRGRLVVSRIAGAREATRSEELGWLGRAGPYDYCVGQEAV